MSYNTYPTQPSSDSSNYPNKSLQSTAPNPYDQPPPYQTSTYNASNDSREQKFREIINKYEISLFFADKLQLLNMFKIVFVFDDSGSMNATLSDSPLNSGLLKATRWDELQYFSKISIEIANIFNENGTDIYFLNRPMARHISSADQLLPYFQNKPSGYTPISRVLRTILANNHPGELGERKLLIIIVTDGEPTDDYGRVDTHTFKEVLKSRNHTTYTTIVSCTDEDETMNYLNNWDKTLPRLDVVDDYRNERLEILRAQGRTFSFSFGDYVVKSIIGSIDQKLDNLDENFYGSNQGCCAVL
ncbi:von Willebrand type A [Brachionus plicatilis]|uniref:von Willebrand type A n=1 Tax=Brachionus plicatilis TaxID=10195 RepID=A0A3M7S2V4_BRAPC|nr:von Willebrand type A [Brachionus plicatilis]